MANVTFNRPVINNTFFDNLCEGDFFIYFRDSDALYMKIDDDKAWSFKEEGLVFLEDTQNVILVNSVNIEVRL